MSNQEFKDLLKSPSYEVAPKLIGAKIIHSSPSGKISATVTEVEAYEQDDPASHSFSGKSDRNKAMFGPSGHAYVYLSYGMHWCLNVVTDKDGYGSGVLIRGVHVIEGQDLAAKNRFKVDRAKDLKPVQLKTLSDGPGKVTQALGVTKELYGTDFFSEDSPLRIEAGGEIPSEYIIQTPRIGISKAVDRPWRWLLSAEYFKYQSAV